MDLIKQFMKIGGFKTREELEAYGEDRFFNDFPQAKQYAKGGAIETYPQTATMNNFFSYGAPVPPTYYAHGGAFPMAQAENQFFSPFYGNVPNPYNKAMGGSAYPQSMSFPDGDTGRSTHFMMQDGGYTADEQQLPKMGVDGKLTNFLAAVKNTATNKLNRNVAENGLFLNPEQYKDGGNLRRYQSKKESAQTDPLLDRVARGMHGDSPIFKPLNLPQIDANSDIGTTGTASQPAVNNYYYGPQGTGMQLPPEFYNDIDYLYGRRRPLSDFNIRGRGIAGNYRSTGWLEDEHGLDKLRQLGLTDITQDNPKWYQFLKRPSKTYHFGNQGQGMGYTPGTVDQQGMPVNTPAAQTPGQQTPGATPDAPGASPKDRDGMGFLARMLYKKGNMTGLSERTPLPAEPGTTDALSPRMQSQFDPSGYNPDYSEARNQIFQNRRRRMGSKLDTLYQKEADMNELYDRGLSERDRNKMARLEKKLTKSGHRSGYSFYEQPISTVDTPTKTIPAPVAPPAQSQQTVDAVTDFKQVGNQPVGGTTIVPPSQQVSTPAPSGASPMSQLYLNALKQQSANAGVTNPQNISGADMQRMLEILPSYTTSPDGFAYGGYTTYAQGGSYNAGDVVDMTPEELQKFIEMGGQVEFLD